MKESIWSKDFISLVAVNAVAFFSFQILFPLLPVYGMEFTTNKPTLGFLAAAIAIAALLARPFSGVIADRGNRKWIIIVTQLLTALVIASFAFAPSIHLLIAARFIHGLLFGIGTTAISLAAVQTLPESSLGRGIGILGLGGFGSQAVAPALGIYLVNHFSYDAMFFIAAAISAAAVVPALTIKPQLRPAHAVESLSVKNIIAVEGFGVSALALIIATGSTTVSSFLVLFGTGRGIGHIGLFFTIFAAAIIVCRLAGGGLIDKYPFQYLVYVCAALCAAGLLLISFATHFSSLIAAALLMGVGYGMIGPTLQAQCIRSVPPERRGAAIATYFIALDLGNIVGPLGMGFIASVADYGFGFLVLSVPTLAMIPLAYLLVRTRKPLKDPK